MPRSSAARSTWQCSTVRVNSDTRSSAGSLSNINYGSTQAHTGITCCRCSSQPCVGAADSVRAQHNVRRGSVLPVPPPQPAGAGAPSMHYCSIATVCQLSSRALTARNCCRAARSGAVLSVASVVAGAVATSPRAAHLASAGGRVRTRGDVRYDQYVSDACAGEVQLCLRHRPWLATQPNQHP